MNHQPVVFQVIPNLIMGGAERVFVNLLLNHEQFKPVGIVIKLPVGSLYEQMLNDQKVPLHFLHMRNPLYVAGLLKLHLLLKQYRPQVVHCHLGALVYTYPLLRLHKVPAIMYTVHNMAHADIGRGLRRKFNQYIFREGTKVVPVSIAEEVQRSVAEVYGYKDSPIIFNGVPVEEFTPNPEKRIQWRRENGFEEDAILLVHVARYDPRKNQPLLVRVAGRIQSQKPLYLLMVGSSGTVPEIRQMVDELNLHHRIKLLGIREDLPDILNASDIFVFPSVLEGNPMAIQEAMSAGLPIASTTVGGIPELVGHGEAGLLCPPEDDEAFLKIVQQLVDDADLRKQMGAKARQRAIENCSAQAMTRRYEQLYKEILQKAEL